MLLQIDPALPVPLYRQLADQVVFRMAAGELREGDQLPSIRVLATRLRINPNTVIKAYRELEHRGFADSRHGRGFFVSASGVEPARAEWRREALERLREAAMRASAVGLGLREILAEVEQAIREGEAS